MLLSNLFGNNDNQTPGTVGGGGGGLNSLISGGLSLIPGGGLISGGLSTLTGMFSPGGLFGGGIPGHENNDGDKIANAVGITRDQVFALCGMVEDEAGKGGPNFDDIVKDYASHPEELVGLIPRYNRKHPDKPIVPTGGSMAPAQTVTPYVQQTPLMTMGFTGGNFGTQTPPIVSIPRFVDQTAMQNAAANTAQNFSAGGLVKATLGGAQQAATDYVMDTPEGHKAKNEGAISWVKDNVVYFILGGIALGALIFKAFFSKK